MRPERLLENMSSTSAGNITLRRRALEIFIGVALCAAVFFGASFAVKAMQGANRDRVVAEHRVRLQILNGCGSKGAGGEVADRIKKLISLPVEVSIIDVDNFSVFDIERSFVISRIEDLDGARAFARQLGLSSDDIVYSPLEDNYRTIHATLVVGKDYREKFFQ